MHVDIRRQIVLLWFW